MERYIDFNYDDRDRIIAIVRELTSQIVFTKMNTIRRGEKRLFRLSVVGNENDVDFYLQQLNAQLD